MGAYLGAAGSPPHPGGDAAPPMESAGCDIWGSVIIIMYSLRIGRRILKGVFGRFWVVLGWVWVGFQKRLGKWFGPREKPPPPWICDTPTHKVWVGVPWACNSGHVPGPLLFLQQTSLATGMCICLVTNMYTWATSCCVQLCDLFASHTPPRLFPCRPKGDRLLPGGAHAVADAMNLHTAVNNINLRSMHPHTGPIQRLA